ncbi:MAG: DUF3841 domain-containing protein [Myxococcales bacterium]|nr:DUF3841 domain-containing protein [Myxococcales bacterium]
MRLWTIQARQAWERVHASPYLERAGARPAIDPAHRAAYGWMREQMQQRIGASSAREAWPIWAWADYGAGGARPDLRASGHLPRGCPGVRVAFEIDERDVLLSDFEAWHFVLNGAYLPHDDADLARFEARARALGAASWDLLSSPLRDEVQRSWQRIFDLVPRARRATQATLWRVPLGAVVDVTCFIAR